VAPPAMLEWIRSSSKRTDVTMSVCTGAFLLAKSGLFSGQAMTTHHGAYDALATQNPDVTVVRGARFVDNGNLASSGGLTSGIDLAFHLVERYFGRDIAAKTALQTDTGVPRTRGARDDSRFDGCVAR
jgi:transcriptional regulator GlxA family with amidase domain